MADANLYTPYLQGKALQMQLNQAKQEQAAQERKAADEEAQRQAMMDYYQVGNAREMYSKQLQAQGAKEQQAAYFDGLKKVSDTMDIAMKLEQESPGQGQKVIMAAYNDPMGGKIMRGYLGETPPTIQRSPEGGAALDVYSIAEDMPFATITGKKGIMKKGKSYRMIPTKKDPTQLAGVVEIPTPNDKTVGSGQSPAVIQEAEWIAKTYKMEPGDAYKIAAARSTMSREQFMMETYKSAKTNYKTDSEAKAAAEQAGIFYDQIAPQYGDKPKTPAAPAAPTAPPAAPQTSVWDKIVGMVSGDKKTAPTKQVKRTGTYNGKKVIEYTDGTVEYAN